MRSKVANDRVISMSAIYLLLNYYAVGELLLQTP